MSGERWTPAEDALMRALYARSSTRRGRALQRCCEALPHRTRSAISSRATELGAAVYGRAWTRDEVVILRREWGEVGERTLRAKLPGRTARAIYAKASDLGLPPQSDGRESLEAAARRLGVDELAVRKLVAEGGFTLGLAAPLAARERRYARRAVDADALEVLLHLRDLRCTTSSAWDTEHGLSRSVTASRVRRAGLPVRRAPGGRVYVPAAVLAEVHAGRPGAACELWRRAVDVAREVSCAPWVLHLAATDLRDGGDAAEWVALWLPQRVEAAARELASPVPVRCDEERAA